MDIPSLKKEGRNKKLPRGGALDLSENAGDS